MEPRVTTTVCAHFTYADTVVMHKSLEYSQGYFTVMITNLSHTNSVLIVAMVFKFHSMDNQSGVYMTE